MALKKSNQFDMDEVFRQLRTNIEFMRIEDDIKVINITSTTKNEGKTTVAANLARIFSAKNTGVLLIDCDLRNPSIHRELEISNSAGLTDILINVSMENTVALGTLPQMNRLRFTEEGYELYVLTAGTRVPNPAELLSSRRFKRFLEMARGQFNYIIIDCPPVGFVSDAIPVANLCDGTLFVASAKEKHKKVVRMCINDLIRNGANVLGMVLNKVDMSTQKYGYGYYYDDDQRGKKRKFGKKKNKLFSIVLMLLFLVGCARTPSIKQEDAIEISLDAAGISEEEAQNIDVKKENGYVVTFTTATGEYTYKVGTDGIIISNDFKSIDGKSVPQEENGEESQGEEGEEETQPETNDYEYRAYDANSATDEEKHALEVSLNNLRVLEDSVKNIEVKHDKDGNIYIRFIYIQTGSTVEYTVNSEGYVVSSYIS